MKKLENDNQKRVHSAFKNDFESKLNSTATQSYSNSIYKGRIEDYIIGKEIGKGAYAVVKTSVHRPTQGKVAIKVYEKIKLNDIHKRNAVKREIEVLKKVDFDNIVHLYEVIDTVKQVSFYLSK